MTAALATLAIGAIVGYMAQRSRMCFIGGIRDFVLIRDTALLKGLGAFALTVWVAFPLAGLLSGSGLGPFQSADAVTVILTLLGGAGVGYVSTLANGCPLRQHVLAAQGAASSVAYLAGFLAGAVLFDVWVAPAIFSALP